MRLLICAWRTNECALPADDSKLGRMVGDPKNWHRLKPVVMAFFHIGDDGLYRQKRLSDEREYVSHCAARSSAGGHGKALKSRHMAYAKPLLNECQISAPTPTPIKESKKDLLNEFVVGKKNGKENGVTIQNPMDRLARFDQKLAASFPEYGWLIVAAAHDPDNPRHQECMDLCKKQAKLIGKGWPNNWYLTTNGVCDGELSK